MVDFLRLSVLSQPKFSLELAWYVRIVHVQSLGNLGNYCSVVLFGLAIP